MKRLPCPGYEVLRQTCTHRSLLAANAEVILPKVRTQRLVGLLKGASVNARVQNKLNSRLLESLPLTCLVYAHFRKRDTETERERGREGERERERGRGSEARPPDMCSKFTIWPLTCAVRSRNGLGHGSTFTKWPLTCAVSSQNGL